MEFLGRKNGLQVFVKITKIKFFENATFTSGSLAKSRRTAKIPTILSSLLQLLSIPITTYNLFFLPVFEIFVRGYFMFFSKNGKTQNFLGLNANGLEIKRRARRGVTFFILAFIFVMAVKPLFLCP